jgi:hypothetical protein
MVDNRLIPLEGCKEEYEKANALTAKVFRAEISIHPAHIPATPPVSAEQPQAAPRPAQQQEHRSPLPPLNAYQPHYLRVDQRRAYQGFFVGRAVRHNGDTVFF